MATVKKERSDETAGSKILLTRGIFVLRPLAGRYDPRELIRRWEKNKKIRVTPEFKKRILHSSHPDDPGSLVRFALVELAGSANEARYMRWLTTRRLTLDLVHLTEVLKPIMAKEPDYLVTDTILLPLGRPDVVVVEDRNGPTPTLDVKNYNECMWLKGTFILSRT